MSKCRICQSGVELSYIENDETYICYDCITEMESLKQENNKLKEALKELLTIAKIEIIQTDNTHSGAKWINKLNGIIERSEELLKEE